MQKLRWGVLGAARIARKQVVPALQTSALNEVVAVAARDLSRAQAFAAETGIPRAIAGYDALLADPDIDAVYIPLPNDLHVPLSIAALDAGKHVLCEKPIALTVAELDRLIAARDRTGKVVTDGLMIRFHPQWQRTLALTRAGAIGAVRSIHTEFSFMCADPTDYRLDASKGGGALYDIGVYAITAARYLLGEEPVAVTAQTRLGGRGGADLGVDAVLKFASGAGASFTCAIDRIPYQRVQVFGDQGRIDIELPFNPPSDEVTRIFVDQTGTLPPQPMVEEFKPANHYRGMVDAFARAALDGVAPPYPLEDARATLRIVDALFLASREQRWVSLG